MDCNFDHANKKFNELKEMVRISVENEVRIFMSKVNVPDVVKITYNELYGNKTTITIFTENDSFGRIYEYEDIDDIFEQHLIIISTLVQKFYNVRKLCLYIRDSIDWFPYMHMFNFAPTKSLTLICNCYAENFLFILNTFPTIFIKGINANQIYYTENGPAVCFDSFSKFYKHDEFNFDLAIAPNREIYKEYNKFCIKIIKVRNLSPPTLPTTPTENENKCNPT